MTIPNKSTSILNDLHKRSESSKEELLALKAKFAKIVKKESVSWRQKGKVQSISIDLLLVEGRRILFAFLRMRLV